MCNIADHASIKNNTLMSKQVVLPYTVSAITVKDNLKFYSFIRYYPCSARHKHSQPLCCQTVHPRLPGPHQTVNFIVINSNVYALLSQYCLSSLIPTCSPSTVFQFGSWNVILQSMVMHNRFMLKHTSSSFCVCITVGVGLDTLC